MSAIELADREIRRNALRSSSTSKRYSGDNVCTREQTDGYSLTVQGVTSPGTKMVMVPPGDRRKFEINPMKNYATRPRDLKQRTHCGARTRAGGPCQRPPIRGRKRCRLHGGLSPGAPRGPKNGNFKSGDWTAEAIAERKWLGSIVQSFAKRGLPNEG